MRPEASGRLPTCPPNSWYPDDSKEGNDLSMSFLKKGGSASQVSHHLRSKRKKRPAQCLQTVSRPRIGRIRLLLFPHDQAATCPSGSG